MWARVGVSVEAARLGLYLTEWKGRTYVSWVTCPLPNTVLANFTCSPIWLGDCSIRQLLLDNYLWWNWGSRNVGSTFDKHPVRKWQGWHLKLNLFDFKVRVHFLIICFYFVPVLALQGKEGHQALPAFSTLWGQRRLTLVFRGEHTTVDRWETTVLP